MTWKQSISKSKLYQKIWKAWWPHPQYHMSLLSFPYWNVRTIIPLLGGRGKNRACVTVGKYPSWLTLWWRKVTIGSILTFNDKKAMRSHVTGRVRPQWREVMGRSPRTHPLPSVTVCDWVGGRAEGVPWHTGHCIKHHSNREELEGRRDWENLGNHSCFCRCLFFPAVQWKLFSKSWITGEHNHLALWVISTNLGCLITNITRVSKHLFSLCLLGHSYLRL